MKKINSSVIFLSMIVATAEANEPILEKKHLELDQIIVTAEKETEKTNGVQKLDSSDIQFIPKGDLNLDSLVRNNPSVQFNSGHNSSELAGEIAPSNISFHGEHFYNNQFSLDGVSNTSNLNPAHNNGDPTLHRYDTEGHTPNKLPAGHTQAFWISTNLLDNVEIHDSNVSARHGRFTGGFIDTELIKAEADEFSGKISYRYSNDDWTHYYIDSAYEAEFSRGESARTQPRFQKHQFHINLNLPINEDTAMLIAYDREESHIPLYHSSLGINTKQARRAETFYLNLKRELNAQNIIDASLLYSPHKGTYFPRNVKNGQFSNLGGGFRADIDWENHNTLGTLNSKLSYRDTQETTDYDSKDLYRYMSGTPSIDWVTDAAVDEATKGGLGKTKLFTKNITLKQDMTFNPFTVGDSDHKVSIGWQYEYGQSGIRRKHHSSIYASDTTDKIDCSYCIPGEQYFTWIGHNYPVDTKIGNSSAAIWLEDSISYQKLALNLGARADYNQFLKNIDIAPRLNWNYDLDDGLALFGGLNRYYGTGILEYKLRSSYKNQDNYRRVPNPDPDSIDDSRQPWEHDETLDSWGFGTRDMKTPYSDEINFGIKQNTDALEWQGKWVRRFSRDQFMTHGYEDEKGRWIRELTNNGRGTHDTLSLMLGSGNPLSISGTNFSWKFGADYQNHQNNQHGTYKQMDWNTDKVEKVMVDGQLYDPEDMPAVGEFSRPWGAFLNTELEIPEWNLTWAQNIRYEKGRTFYDQKSIRCKAAQIECQGHIGNLSKFDGIKFNDSIITDWRFAWKPLSYEKNLTINVDILNVFNRKIVGKKINTPEWEEKKREVSYQSGRQYWLGMEYQW